MSQEQHKGVHLLIYKLLDEVSHADKLGICNHTYIQGWIEDYVNSVDILELKHWQANNTCSSLHNKHETYTYMFTVEDYTSYVVNVHYDGNGHTKLMMETPDTSKLFVSYQAISKYLKQGYNTLVVLESILKNIKNQPGNCSYLTIDELIDILNLSESIVKGCVEELINDRLITTKGGVIIVNDDVVMRGDN